MGSELENAYLKIFSVHTYIVLQLTGDSNTIAKLSSCIWLSNFQNIFVPWIYMKISPFFNTRKRLYTQNIKLEERPCQKISKWKKKATVDKPSLLARQLSQAYYYGKCIKYAMNIVYICIALYLTYSIYIKLIII